MNKKYFFFDIDGTLLGWTKDWQKVIPDSTKLAIQKLKDNGHFLAIATGRSRAMAKEFMDMFDIHSMVHDGGNGATINDELVYIEPLDHDLCAQLVEECKQKGIAWGLQPINEIYRLVPDNSFFEATNDVYMESRIVEGLDVANYDKIFKMYIACTVKQQEELETLKKLPWARYHDEYLFVEPTDKSRGIYKIMEILDAPIEDVVVFGDDYNDLTMFIDKWTCIAMGNAKQEVKDRATYVTDDVMNDGIYKALEHFGWI